MIKALFLACALIGLASAATVQAAPAAIVQTAPTPNVACGPICIGGDGRPPCQDWNLGSYWTPPGHKYVCVRIGSTDQWAIIY